ncbi:MAG TPA: protein kinase [Anaerolineae bacterium]|nr:protein kinase [Anaerolineae bacterium]
MSDPLIGKTLGQFEILEAIGQGGMALVYKARQPAMNRIVALKVLSSPMTVNPTFLTRFKQEAQMIATLEHAHILPVYDMGEQDGWVFIAMRYMSHGTLTSRIAQGPIPLKDVGQWIEQIGSALDYAHQRGVVHRDVKPSNVLLDAQGNSFLADFGIAKWSGGSISLTGSGVIGTPQYMSPEQGQGLKIDGRSDEYSLAVMAYEMIIGKPPFEAETPLAIVLKHITEPLTPPISINPRVPQPVSDVISKALSKDPNDRYPTTAAFAQALTAVIAAAPVGGTLPLPTAAPTEEVHLTKHEPGKAPRRFRPIAVVAALFVLLTMGIGGLVLVSRNQPPPDRPAATIGLGPNVIVETPTPAATPISTSAITETSTVNADRCTPPLFAETFDNPGSGLPRGEQDDSRWGYLDGAYQLLINVANKMQTRLIGPPLTDYDATVEARFASDKLGSYGLVAAARSQNDYYALMIDGAGRYAITRRSPQGTQAIRDWTYSPAINEGQAFNHLRAVQRGTEIEFYANDMLLKIVQDEGDPAAKRSIGLTVASFNTGTDVRFDNLRVCPPTDRSAARQVTLFDTFDDNRNGWAPQQFTPSGGSAIENGQFTFEAVYTRTPYVVMNWNPNIAFAALDLQVAAQVVTGTPASRVGVIFGVQDFGNYYRFDMTNDGWYHLYRQQAGEEVPVTEGASPFIHTNLASNRIHLSVVSNTLSIAVNDRVVMQATIDYTPGFIGLWCGAYRAGSTRCAFDNLQATGTPSDRLLIIYPFCNCRRTVYGDQPLEVRWSWRAKTPEYLNQFKAGTTMTVTIDGVPVDKPQQYWTLAAIAAGEADMFWIYPLPALEPGAHLIDYAVWTDRKLTDGLDGNGDGQLDTYGPGDILTGYVEVVVQP